MRLPRLRRQHRLDPIADTAFAKFLPWSGVAPAGYDVNWLGQRTDLRFVEAAIAHPDQDARVRERRIGFTSYPPADEEIFEWWTMLDAVLEASNRFVMVELGAGYGRWLVSAALALRQAHPGMPSYLIGIEGDPDHYGWLLQHFRDNGLDTTEHRLLHGAVSERDGEGEFAVNDNPSGWWGQWLMRPNLALSGVPNLRTEPIKTYSIETLLSGIDRVDYMDFDIQGAEDTAIAAGIDVMTRKTKRVFVETHGTEIHAAVAHSFRTHGWKCLHSYGMQNGYGSEDQTPFGVIRFEGGVQCWANPSVR